MPWFISGFIFKNNLYYKIINKPSFAPPAYVFPIVWTIIFILLAISIYKIYINKLYNSRYLQILFINYVFNQLYTYFFFYLKSPICGFIDALFVFLSTYLLFYETKKLDKRTGYFIIPYLVWDTYATILSFAIFIMNI
jgi:tryptophan-rich sensory protein